MSLSRNDKPVQPLRINGKPATQKEVKRVLDAPATPAKNDLASKPYVARPFSILKRG